MLPEQDLFLEELYQKHAKKLFFYAFARIQDGPRAQDIVQDTFHTAVRRIDVLMAHENPAGWLMEVLKRKLSESERARRRCILRFISLETEAAGYAGGLPDPAESLAETETTVLRKIRAALSDEEYLLLKRFIFDGASHLEIAKEFGITVYASQKRLERVRKKLHQEFPEYRAKK